MLLNQFGRLGGAAASPPNIEFVGQKRSWFLGTSGATITTDGLTGGIAAAASPGDVIILFAPGYRTSGSVFFPNITGGTPIINVSQAGYMNFYKFDSGISHFTEAGVGSVSVPASPSPDNYTCNYFLSVWRGVNATSPIRNSNHAISTLSNGPPVSLATAAGGGVIVGCGMGATQNNLTWLTSDLGNMENVGTDQVHSTGFWTTMFTGRKDLFVGTATMDPHAGATSDVYPTGTFLLELNPA